LLFLSAVYVNCLLQYCPALPPNTFKTQITVDVRKNTLCLLNEEDTDSDEKITIDDHFAGSGRGDRHFVVVDVNGSSYEVSGTYYLSNLLQQLALAAEQGNRISRLDPSKIFENPVSRIRRNIREIYWDGLTRRIDEEGLETIFKDTKTTTVDGCRYLYVPFKDKTACDYFSEIARKRPLLRMKAVRLPESISPQWVQSRNGCHGLLSLALERKKDGGYRGVPFVVPGGRFNEMYGWDSFFIVLGLLEDGRVDLAKAMVDNFVYEITYYGQILNANRSYYLMRCQPPFLTSMALAVYKHLPKNNESKQWLKKALQAAIKEYKQVWMGKKRLTETGLSRYYGEGIGPAPEVEPGHFDSVFARYAEKLGKDAKEFETAYRKGQVKVPELDAFFTHDRSMRESGHDRTYRWAGRCSDFVTVDLNSLLYKIERDIASIIETCFGGSLRLADNTVETSSVWHRRAERRKKLMNQFLWDQERGLFLDYDLVNKKTEPYITPVIFYPLWANLADRQQAASTVRAGIAALEAPGGLVASTKESRGELSQTRPATQWDWPYGWAPHQMLAWDGLLNYGYDEIAHRLIYRWLYTITKNAVDYNGTIPEKFDVVKRSHQVFAEYGNVGTKFAYITKEGFGWMNASYQVGLKLLPQELQSRLARLIPPEQLYHSPPVGVKSVGESTD